MSLGPRIHEEGLSIQEWTNLILASKMSDRDKVRLILGAAGGVIERYQLVDEIKKQIRGK